MEERRTNLTTEPIFEQAAALARELAERDERNFRPVKLMVVGMSSSEIVGGTIGHASAFEYGEAAICGILSVARELGFDVAVQCCEHLNRALVVEETVAEKYGLEAVCVVPQVKAGGSAATAAWKHMNRPVGVEAVRADAGLDVGQTLVGMHLRPVAVPVRLAQSRLGEAIVTAARTRPKLIGGERAKYE